MIIAEGRANLMQSPEGVLAPATLWFVTVRSLDVVADQARSRWIKELRR
jgi:hypothetical protein